MAYRVLTDAARRYEWEDEPTEVLPADSPMGANVVLILACYGMGEPTDSARPFYEWVMRGADGDTLDAVRFAVFGLGSSKTHGQYCAFPGCLIQGLCMCVCTHAPAGCWRGGGCCMQTT